MSLCDYFSRYFPPLPLTACHCFPRALSYLSGLRTTKKGCDWSKNIQRVRAFFPLTDNWCTTLAHFVTADLRPDIRNLVFSQSLAGTIPTVDASDGHFEENMMRDRKDD